MTYWQRLRMFQPTSLPPVASDYRLAHRLRMTVLELRRSVTVREYRWWIAMLKADDEAQARARQEADRGR